METLLHREPHRQSLDRDPCAMPSESNQRELLRPALRHLQVETAVNHDLDEDAQSDLNQVRMHLQ